MGRPMRSFSISETASRAINERAIPDARRGGGKPNFSRVVSNVVDRYAEIVRQHRPSFAPNEWDLLAAAIGEKHLDEPFQIRALEGLVADAIALDKLGKKHKVSPDFVGRIGALGFAEKVAIVDEVELRRARGG